MARTGSAGGGFLKILLLFVLILVLVFGGLIWFDFLGLVNMKGTLEPLRKLVGFKGVTEIEDDGGLYLLDNERLKKQQEAIDISYEALEQEKEEIVVAQSRIQQQEQELIEKEKSLQEKEKSLNQERNKYENKEENLKQSARYLMGMDPQSAVAQMVNMDEYDAVNLLRTAERVAQEEGTASLVAYWLSLMEPDKAASLQAKLIQSPDGDLFAEEQWFNE